MNKQTREYITGIICALLVVLLWSSFHIVSRVGVQTSLTPYDLVALRLGVGGVIMLPVMLHYRLGSLKLSQAIILAMLAGPGFSIFAFTGYQFAPAAHGAAILAGAIPLFTAPMAWYFLGERLSLFQISGLSVILIGIILLAGASFTGFNNMIWRGDLLFIIGVADWAVFTLLARTWRVEPVRGTALVAVISMTAYLPIYILFLPSSIDTAPPIQIYGQAIYQGFFSMIITLLLFTRAVEVLGATLTTTITAAVPATAALAALILLGEQLTEPSITGVVLVSIGMIAAVLGSRPEKR